MPFFFLKKKTEFELQKQGIKIQKQPLVSVWLSITEADHSLRDWKKKNPHARDVKDKATQGTPCIWTGARGWLGSHDQQLQWTTWQVLSYAARSSCYIKRKCGDKAEGESIQIKTFYVGAGQQIWGAFEPQRGSRQTKEERRLIL